MSIDPRKVSAVIRTRGNRDLSEIIPTLPYDEVIVSYDDDGKGIYGRWEAAMNAKHDVIYFQDDDVIFRRHFALCDAYEDDGRVYCQMRPEWTETCRYFDLCMVGEGALVPKEVMAPALNRYLEVYDADEDFFRHTDFIMGVLLMHQKLDLGVEILDVASDDSALWHKPDQFEGKWRAIHKARALRKIVLTILTKNESANIQRAITSAFPWFDSVLIHDSGSTDDTLERAAATCDLLEVPLTIRRTEMKMTESGRPNFGDARARLLADARQFGDYQLLIDADEEWIDVPLTRPELAFDSYMIHYDGEFDWAHPRLIRSGVDWIWMDEVHSWIAAEGPIQELHLPAPLIVHHGEERGTNEDRLKRDVNEILRMLDERPLDPRSVFNLAKALEGLGIRDKARDAFQLRSEMGGWPEEAWYAKFRWGCLAMSESFADGADILLEAYRERPWRIEPLRVLAEASTQVADKAPYPEGESLFVQRSHYRKQETENGTRQVP